MTELERKNLKRQIIVEELIFRGYEAREVIISNNGIKKTKIQICTGTGIDPIVYIDDMIEAGKSVGEIIHFITEIAEKKPSFNPYDFTTWDYAKNHLVLCLQKKTDENILKQDFLDLEMYVRVKIGNNIYYKIRNGMFEVSPYEIFTLAMEQLMKNGTTCSLIDKIFDMVGTEKDLGIDQSLFANSDYIVAGNKDDRYGAGVIVNPEFLGIIANHLNCDLIIIPSSVHEVLILPDNGDYEYEAVNAMVKEVNSQNVPIEERLSNHIYIYKRDLKTLISG